jgi:ABC-2 type transport system permease protein
MNTANPRSAIRNPQSVLGRYFGIYVALLKNSIAREMGFKANFLLWIVVDVAWFALQLTFMGVLYLHTDSIGTWTKWEVVMLVGASHFIQQIFQALFLNNCTQLSENVRLGKFDFMLLLPVNTRFLVSFRLVDLGSLVNACSAIAVMAYAARQMHLVPAPLHVLGFLLLCAVGIFIHYSLMFILASISFRTVRAQGIIWGYYSLFNIARLPDSALRGLFKAVFTFVLPMVLVANVPVKLLVQKLSSPGELLLLVALSGVCFAVSEWFWRLSVRHYTSASS